MPNNTLHSESAPFEIHSSVVLVAIFTLLLAAGTSYTYFIPFTNDTKKIHQLGGLSIINAWTFFNKRYDFQRSNFKKTGQALFSFRVLQHEVVAMSGEEARMTFFNEKDLNFGQGYRLLMGGLGDIKVENEDSGPATFNKRLLKIIRKERLQDLLSTLFSDISRRMEPWGTKGKMNPFENIYDLVIQMTIRMATCEELAADPRTVQHLGNLYWKLEKSATPVGLLLPWFPGTAKKVKEEASMELYSRLSHYVDIRRKAEVPSSDAIDSLIADGADTAIIVEFVIAVVFAGVVNTGMIACWTLLYLSANEEWKGKASAEVQKLMVRYTNMPSQPVHQRLSMIPISAWEDETPVLESIIRETLRLVKNDTALRRNIHNKLQVADKTIEKGTFMAYNMGDVHLNELFYSEPLKFDPDRFNPPRDEDKRGNILFLGWGAGRHPCAGMKFAKLEIKIILSIMLSCYEYKLVDGLGNTPKQLPQPNRNDIHQARPIGEPCFLEYTKVAQ